MQRETPKIDSRKFSDVLALLHRTAPHYTPEWPATDEKDSGVALLKVFSHLAETIIKRLNQTPHKNFVAFLNMLGVKLLPGQPSRVPLHFKLAQGTSDEVFIPARTRATSDNPELPFETEEDLRATPSALAQVVSIDPAKDTIYKPPRGFLERELPDQSQVRYRLIAFSRAGSNTLQLDHTDNLEKGDLLKLGSAEAAHTNGACMCVANTFADNDEAAGVEYLTIEKINGTIVELTTKLKRDYSPDAPLAKITQFHVFESKNLQEHILFLGHKDLFNVKSLAQFTLAITHLSGTEGGIAPLAIAWEYWGEEKGTEGSDWRPFKVEFDGSNGLSQSGELTLLKPTEGEIAEFEINGITSRWIRARLQEPLPTTEARRLPVLDNIKFKVQSAGKALPPDQAFHDDTPLDFNLPFYPFGLEPRLFDKFQLASKEAFSKKGAEIKIDVRLDSVAILAAPAAVLTKDTEEEKIVNVFARGTAGRLLELEITFRQGIAAGIPEWINHGTPEETSLAIPDKQLGTEAAPSVVRLNSGILLIYAKAENGQLIEYVIRGNDRFWFTRNLPTPEGKIKYDPSAVQSGANEATVFVVGEDGALYRMRRDLNRNSTLWSELGTKPDGKNLDSSPYAVKCDNSYYIKVFVKGNDDLLYEWDENDRAWLPHPPPSAAAFKMMAKPFAQLKCEGDRGSSSILNLAVAALEIIPSSVPDGQPTFREFQISLTAEAYSGFTIVVTCNTVESGSQLKQQAPINNYGANRAARLDLRHWLKIPPPASEYTINTAVSGVVLGATGSKEITLENTASDLNDAYVGLNIDIKDSTDTIGHRLVSHYLGTARKVTFNVPLNDVPDKSFRYEIHTGHEGAVRSATPTTIVIDQDFLPNDGAYKNLFITASDQKRKILSFDRAKKEITISEEWEAGSLPTNGNTYKIENLSGVIQAASPATLILDAKASKNNGAYNGLTITVTPSSSIITQQATIISYSNQQGALIAEVDKSWNPLPGRNSIYSINDFKGKIESATGFAVYEKVWVQDDAGRLRELDTHLPEGARWKDLGMPSPEVKVASSPHGYIEQMGMPFEERHIFVRGTDENLWERKRDDPTPTANGDSPWEAHFAPVEAELRHSPFLLRFSSETKRYSIYSSSNKNAILERELKLSGKVSGTAQVGTNFSITLDDSAKPDFMSAAHYIKITKGKLIGVLRRIKDYIDKTPAGRLLQVAHLVWGWAVDPTEADPTRDLPDSTSAYKIGKEEHDGQVENRAMATITLATEASQENNAYNGFNIIITDANGVPKPPPNSNRIVSYRGHDRLTILQAVWQEVPNPTNDYYKIDLEHTGVPKELIPAGIKLDAEASTEDDAYKHMKISITRGSNPPIENEVIAYFQSTKTALVRNNWSSNLVPERGDPYVLTIVDPNTKLRPPDASNPIIKLLDSSIILDAYKDLEITVVDANGVEQNNGIMNYSYDAINKVGVATLGEGWENDQVPDERYSYLFRGLEHGDVHPPVDQRAAINTIYLDVAEVEAVAGGRNGAFDGFEITVTSPDESLGKRKQRKRVSIESSTQVRKITSFSVSRNQRGELSEALATVNEDWDLIDSNDPGSGRKIPDHTYTYSVRAIKRRVQSAELATITLASTDPLKDNPLNDLKIDVKQDGNPSLAPQTKVIKTYDRTNKLVKVGGSWNPIPNDPTKFFYAIRDDGVVQEKATLASVKLDASANKATENKGAYDGLQLIVIKDQGANQPRQEVQITSYHGDNDRIAYIAENWNSDLQPLGLAPSYKITILPRHPQSATASTITLNSVPELQLVGMDIVIGDRDRPSLQQVRTIKAFEPTTKIALVDKPWDTIPEIGAPFVLVNYAKADGTPIHEGLAQVGTKQTITFEQKTAANSGEYERRKLAVSRRAGATPEQNVIDEYLGPERIAVLEQDWREKFNTDSVYEIEGEVNRNWNLYEDIEVIRITPQLSWEYWNSKGWVAFQKETHHFVDGTRDLLVDGDVVFHLPGDIELTEVAGQENYWLRARIIGGDYGLPTFTLREEVKGIPDEVVKETRLIPDKKSVRPPLIASLKISYALLDYRFPQQCLTYNNLDYLDQTGACTTTDKRFPPFVRLEEQGLEEACVIETIPANGNGEPVRVAAPTALGKALYLGFQEKINGGPIKIFFAAKELPYSDSTKPKMEWSYRAENEWKRLSFDDDTEGLIKQEILQFIVPRDLTQATRFGASQHWIRGMLVEGNYEGTPELSGIYPNTTWAFQAETILDEALGSSNGEAHQTFHLFKFPVRENEVVRVQEVLTEEEKAALKQSLGESALHEVKDELGKVLETWVRWQEVENFFKSSRVDRHYTLDRATGELRFGDGRNGQIPPAGLNNIRVFSYQAGGGSSGNVAAGAIQGLVTAIANVDAVLNPVAAGAGSDTATLDEMLEHGPAMISHRQRAVTPGDFEWLARQASRLIAKARCVRNLNLKRNEEIGWATVYIVPDSTEPEPQPSLELRRKVREFLEAHCANTIATEHHVFVEGPTYMKINVAADIFVKSIDLAAAVEQSARKKLEDFFHPLTGGPRERGWEFGEDVAASDVYALLEEIAGVDHLERLGFSVNNVAYSDVVEIAPHALVAPGVPSLNVIAISEK